MWLLRPVLVIQNVDRQESGQKKPEATVNILRDESSLGIVTYYTNIPVDRCYLLVRPRFQQLAGYDLFYCQDDTIFTSYTNAGASILHCLNRVFNLRECVSFQSPSIARCASSLESSCRLARKQSSGDRTLCRWMSG